MCGQIEMSILMAELIEEIEDSLVAPCPALSSVVIKLIKR
jgi:hypothetical protein